MKKHFLLALAIVAIATLVALPAAAAMYWPTASWTTATPASVGWDSTDLATAASYASSYNTDGLLVVVDGKIIHESYWNSWDSDSTIAWYSATKTMTAMMVGMAEADGDLELTDDMYSYFTSLNYLNGEGDTVWHHLTMTSGLNQDCDEFVATPGTDWTYNTHGYRMLFYVLEQATGEDLDDYADDRLWTPVGAEHMSWSNAASPTSINPTQKQWMIGSARDMARHGLLMLREGVWNGTELINWEYLDDQTTQSQALNESYGYLTWLGGYDSFIWTTDTEYESDLMPDAPGDTFLGAGAYEKLLYVIPSLNCVVVRLGSSAGVSWVDPADSFINQLVKRVVAAAPADGTAPSTPSNLSATGYDGFVMVDWDHNTDSDIAGYEIYRSTVSGSGYTQLRADHITNLDAFKDTDVTNETTYYYKVKAVDTSGNVSSLTSYTSATPTATPAAPTGLGATPGDASVSLDWDDNLEGDISGYNIYRSTTTGSGFSKINGSLQATSDYTDSTVSNDTTYYYKVTAVDGDSNESAYSSEVSATPEAAGCTPTTEFSDNFEDGNVNGWTTSGTVAANDAAAYNSSYGARFRGTSYLYQVVDMSGYDSVNLEYAISSARLDSGEYIFVEWSTDGSSWTNVESYSNNEVWAVRDQSLGSGAAVSTLYIRFRNNAGGALEDGRVDNVEVVGYCD